LTSMTITLTNHPDADAESLAVDVALLQSHGLSTTGYDPNTGILTITGSADPSVYQAVLVAITYADSATTPSTEDRIIRVVVSDGINTSLDRFTTVTVSAPGP
jgi:hypothetical protein